MIVEKRIQNRWTYWKTNYGDGRATEIMYIYEKEKKEKKIQETVSFNGQAYRTFGTIK
jgi:hypothetical protein